MAVPDCTQQPLRERASTVIVTTVHPLQVAEEVLPETEHDFSAAAARRYGRRAEWCAVGLAGDDGHG
jgi:hypothetical protein